MTHSSRQMWNLVQVIAIVVCALAGTGAQPIEDQPIAIVHGTLLDGRGGPPVQDATVLIRGRVIAAAGRPAEVTIPKDAQVIDASGKTVMPGLADMHVHLMGGWDGDTFDLLGYQRYLSALLYAGVTTVLDTGAPQPWVLQLRQEVAAGRLLGPRIYCVGALVDGVDSAWPDMTYTLTSIAQIPDLVRRQKQPKVDLIKGYENLSPTLLIRLTAAAAKENLRVVLDYYVDDGSPDVVAYGISGFAHLPSRPMSADDVRVIKDKGVFVLTTLATDESHAWARVANLSFLREPLIADTAAPWFIDELKAEVAKTPTETDKQSRDAAPLRLAPTTVNLKKLHDGGVLRAAGTDASSPGVFQGEGIHRELELWVESGLTPLEAIRAATYDAARVMRAEGESGSLEPGRRADVLVIAGQPQKQISDTRKVSLVIREGQILDRQALRFNPKRDPEFRAVPAANGLRDTLQRLFQ